MKEIDRIWNEIYNFSLKKEKERKLDELYNIKEIKKYKKIQKIWNKAGYECDLLSASDGIILKIKLSPKVYALRVVPLGMLSKMASLNYYIYDIIYDDDILVLYIKEAKFIKEKMDSQKQD